MARANRKSMYERQPGETHLVWQLRVARMKADAIDRTQPIVPVEAQANGDYETGFVTHVETNTKAHTARNRGSRLIDRWVKEGAPHFPPGAVVAIAHCEKLWNLCPLIGRQTASYSPPTANGDSAHEYLFRLDARREIERMESWFPRQYWAVFEAIVRNGDNAGTAGRNLASDNGSRTAMAKAVVGMVACHIAMRHGW